MVLLTYRTDSTSCAKTTGVDAQTSENDVIEKNEGPTTAYIEKLKSFKEDDAYEEKCDLFFICQDGEMPAHRLVISNASKLIMTMLQDQSPLYPVYISVPDLNMEIVQTLVQLAYTGQMNLPPGTSSDELLDAMQALGWVNTDCLTATYMDSIGSHTDDDFGSAITSKTAESLETVLKMKFPVATKADTNASDEEDEMELDVPDVLISDEEEAKGAPGKGDNSPKNTGNKGRRLRGRAKPKGKPAPLPDSTTKKVASPRNQKISPPARSTRRGAQEQSSPVPANSETRKNSRKTNDEDVVDSPKSSELQPESNIVIAASSPEAVRSRTRTIRKPKKFDDLIELTPTKRKESPVKTPAKTKQPTKLDSVADKQTKGTISQAKVAATKNKRRTSTNTDSNSLITSYFSKRSPRKSEDITNAEDSSENHNEKDMTETHSVQNDQAAAPANKRRGTGSKDDSNDVDGSDMTNDKHAGNTTSTPVSMPRKRARSTASNKSDKDVLLADGESNHDDSEKATRPKRNLQDHQKSPEPELETSKLSTATRGRKSSTVSNTSKSSNKDSSDVKANDNEVEGNASSADGPRRKRSRQE